MTVAARVYVPTTAPAYVRADIEMRLSNQFDGATTYDARGSWLDDDGNLIVDEMTVVETVANNEDEAADEVERAAKYVKGETDEDAVMWEVRPVNQVGFE